MVGLWYGEGSPDTSTILKAERIEEKALRERNSKGPRGRNFLEASERSDLGSLALLYLIVGPSPKVMVR